MSATYHRGKNVVSASSGKATSSHPRSAPAEGARRAARRRRRERVRAPPVRAARADDDRSCSHRPAIVRPVTAAHRLCVTTYDVLRSSVVTQRCRRGCDRVDDDRHLVGPTGDLLVRELEGCVSLEQQGVGPFPRRAAAETATDGSGSRGARRRPWCPGTDSRRAELVAGAGQHALRRRLRQPGSGG